MAERQAQPYLYRVFAAENLPNILLVVVGAIGIIVAVRTLRAIQKQIETQREQLRARLAIGASQSPFADMIQGEKVLIDVKFINTGGIPAYNVAVESWIEFLDIPFSGFTPNVTHPSGTMVTVHPQEPCQFRMPFGRALTVAEIGRLKAVEATLYLRVRLEYNTLGEPHHTDNVFEVTPTTLNMYSEHCDSN